MIAHGGRASFGVYLRLRRNAVMLIEPRNLLRLGQLGVELAFDLAPEHSPA